MSDLSSPSIPPLIWPQAMRMPTDLQKMLMGIPFLGVDWRAYRAFRKQVKMRSENTLFLWENVQVDPALRDQVLVIIQKNMRWKSRGFIPEDSLEALLLPPPGTDGFEFVDTLLELDEVLVKASGRDPDFSLNLTFETISGRMRWAWGSSSSVRRA